MLASVAERPSFATDRFPSFDRRAQLHAVGFSGLIAALGREGANWPLLTYRLRQIPEFALLSALPALLIVPLVDATHSPAYAIQIATGLALVLRAIHGVVLIRRTRRARILSRTAWVTAGLLDLATFPIGVIALITANLAAFEFLLVVLLLRPAVAFVLALEDVITT